jgi:hypothetical protein
MKGNQITVLPSSQGRSLTAVDVREHVNLIQEVMKAVMKSEVHYGVIPGCKLPSLYKAGSEVLLTTFRIAVSVEVDDLSTADSIRYRVRTVGTHQPTGVIVGEGIGECSSDEEKYKWRKCWNKKEFEATPESRRRIKFTKYGEDMQVRTEPADVANTILKMAKKRAQIDLTLTATAASDIFTQDVEDLPEELRPPAPIEGQPMSGVWDAMDKDQKAELLKIALAVGDFCDSGDVAAAVAFIDKQGLDSDEKAALWSRLDSTHRTALKKAAKAATEAAA